MPEDERAAYAATQEQWRQWSELHPLADPTDLEAVLNQRKAFASGKTTEAETGISA